MEKYYYIIQKNIRTGEQTLLLFNGDKKERTEIFNSLPTNSEDFQFYYGYHAVKFQNQKIAYEELITKPDEFNEALKIIQKYGLMVVSKQPITSYQSFHGNFKL